jgi:hypothetical protein
MRKLQGARLAALVAVGLPLFAGSDLVVDRGLPQQNLNNASGAVRSNVRWGWHQQGFLGDQLTIGAPGERWVIDSIRTWTVPGFGAHRPQVLGEAYEDVRLYFGRADRNLTPVAAGEFIENTGENVNPDIRISEATMNGAIAYDDQGTSLRIWQVEFQNLKLPVEGGKRYSFGVWGVGREVPGESGKRYTWYNHASNAALSGNAQDGADGAMSLFDGAGRLDQQFHAKGNGWDKDADINVQVFAHRVTGAEPGRRATR